MKCLNVIICFNYRLEFKNIVMNEIFGGGWRV